LFGFTSKPSKRLFLPELTSEEFGNILPEIKAGIIPVGSIEWHGPHLPLALDQLTSLYIALMVSEKMYPRILVTAPIFYGVVRDQMRYPGSATVEPHIFIDLIVSICQSLQVRGIDHIVILNGHGSNRPAVLGAALRSSGELGIKVVPACYWDFIPPEEGIKILESQLKAPYVPGEHGYPGYPIPAHGGEFETSIALALFPELVRRERIKDYKDPGTIFSTADKGEKLIKLAVEGLSTWLEDFITAKTNEAKYVYEIDGWGPDLLGVNLWYFLTRRCREFIEAHKMR
jgi:creatinine amidohydrolase